MSNNYGDECITSLIPQPMPEKVKPERYTSLYRQNVAQGYKANKAVNKTMGPAKVNVSSPNEFLKKSSKALPPVAATTKKREGTRKPPVPTRNEQNDPAAPTEKDFIKTNAIENITSVPRKPKAQYCDTNTGHKNDLLTSGLVPRFTLKTDFGKVPEYLSSRKSEVQYAQERYDQYVAEEMRSRALEQIDDKSRQELLTGLKAKWEDLHQKFQGLSVVTDTAPKKNRKERMEAQMSQLERDIDLLERHSTIYVARH
jgi:hypothetical protein